MFFYNWAVFIYSTVDGSKCEINLTVIGLGGFLCRLV